MDDSDPDIQSLWNKILSDRDRCNRHRRMALGLACYNMAIIPIG